MVDEKLKYDAQQHGLVKWVKEQTTISDHFVTTRWDLLDKHFNKSKKWQVHQDLSTALYLRSLGIPKSNIVGWHENDEQRKAMSQLCGKVYKEAQLNMKNFNDVGNVAFSISDEMFLKLNYENPVKMIGPAQYAIAPEFNHGATKKAREIKQLLENNGLKKIIHIPHKFFKQQHKNNPETMIDALVQCCAYITEPGYNGDVEVYNIATGKTFWCKRGSIYPKSDTVFNFYNGTKSSWTKVLDQNPTEVTLQDHVIGFPMRNKSTYYDDDILEKKYSIPLMTKKAEWYKPGNTIPVNTVCFKVDPKKAQSTLDTIVSDDYAKAYQSVCTSSNFSATGLYILNVSPE